MSPLLLPVLAGALSTPAQACGGFFCDRSQPVVQSAERIAFALGPDGTVETHVQITYQGPSEQFAWVVPVPANPEIFLSSDALFNTLATQTAPTFQLRIREEGHCRDPIQIRGANELMVADAEAGATQGSQGGVDVEQSGRVGPYEMVVLRGEDSAELLDWLEANGYALPPGIEPLLAPYVAQDAHFLALRLAKDKDSGDIAPIGFRYPGERPAVPIQLTSVAAAPDMRLEVYVFADQRVVPESYLHVQINEAAVNWWRGGSNYPEVITLAADEAGGQAFATDFAGSPDFLQGSLLSEDRLDLEALRGIGSFDAYVDEVQRQGLVATVQLQQALLACVDAPSGIAASDFLNCPECYAWDRGSFDPGWCTDLLEEEVVEPLRAGEALFTYPWLSRMTSSLDAAEMTVDPVFVPNPDMGEVAKDHVADYVWMCQGGKRRTRALRRLELSDGREILLPSQHWLEQREMTEFQFLRELRTIRATIVERTADREQPEILTDWTDLLFAQADEHNQMVLALEGCGGCSSTGTGAGLWWVGLAALGLVRRRRKEGIGR